MELLNGWLDNTWIAVAAIVLGFVLLVHGADGLVDGASALARRWGVSNLVIGLTVVAFGTSMPEFVVNMVAAANRNTEIAITNILGSNAINIFVILGLTAVIYPVRSQEQCRRFDIPWSLLAGLLVLFFATYTRPMQAGWGSFCLQDGFISGIGGMVLLLCFVVFLWHSFRFAKADTEEKRDNTSAMSSGKAVLFIILGLAGLVAGGELIVHSATRIAVAMGVSDAVIGLTVVALGTSLPELAASCVAAAKHNSDLALGNVIGSNIFNVFFILGTSACITPLPVYPGLWLDAAIVMLSSLMVMLFVYTDKRHEIQRWHGVLLLLVYATYLTYRLMTV